MLLAHGRASPSTANFLSLSLTEAEGAHEFANNIYPEQTPSIGSILHIFLNSTYEPICAAAHIGSIAPQRRRCFAPPALTTSVSMSSVNYCATRWLDSTITAPISACHRGSYTETY